jgi:hypothetical protein
MTEHQYHQGELETHGCFCGESLLNEGTSAPGAVAVNKKARSYSIVWLTNIAKIINQSIQIYHKKLKLLYWYTKTWLSSKNYKQS